MGLEGPELWLGKAQVQVGRGVPDRPTHRSGPSRMGAYDACVQERYPEAVSVGLQSPEGEKGPESETGGWKGADLAFLIGERQSVDGNREEAGTPDKGIDFLP